MFYTELCYDQFYLELSLGHTRKAVVLVSINSYLLGIDNNNNNSLPMTTVTSAQMHHYHKYYCYIIVAKAGELQDVWASNPFSYLFCTL